MKTIVLDSFLFNSSQIEFYNLDGKNGFLICGYKSGKLRSYPIAFITNLEI